MFETVSDDWKRYLSHVGGSWEENDARHGLGAEVTQRLRQLDLIIRLLQSAINDTMPDSAEIQRTQANLPRLQRGEISVEEYIGLTHLTPSNAVQMVEAWDLVSIYTEAFYFWAWRLIEMLNRKGPFAFPSLSQVNARLITIVRNNLIEHPEDRGSQNFTMGMVVTSSGPVLRSLGAVARGDSGRIDPLADSKDQGLFLAAEELCSELNRKIDAAISSSS